MDLHIGALTSRLANQAEKQELSCHSLRQACREFESMFTAYLLKNMRKTIPHAEFIQDGSSVSFSRDVYLSMMDEEIARAVSRGPGMGLAETLYRQLSQRNRRWKA